MKYKDRNQRRKYFAIKELPKPIDIMPNQKWQNKIEVFNSKYIVQGTLTMDKLSLVGFS